MDIQYYRKFTSPRLVTSGFKRLWKRPLLRWFVLLGIPFVIFAIFSSKGILQRVKLEEEKRVWQEKVRRAEEEQKRLEQTSKALDTDTAPGGAVEKVARERYGMVREGETVYRVKKK
jgi:cell division protein FtsB